MRVYGFELRRLAKGTLGWSAGLCALLLIYLSLYPVLRALGLDMPGLLGYLPHGVRVLLGVVELDFGGFAGYLPFPLKLGSELAAIGGLVTGVSAAARDCRQGCADFLYTKPVSRTGVFLAKTAAVATAGLVLLGAATAALLGAARLLAPGEPFAPLQALAASAIPALLFALYGAAGLLLGTVLPGVRGVGGIGVASILLFHAVLLAGWQSAAGQPAVYPAVPTAMFDRALAAGRGLLETGSVLLWGAEVAVLLALGLWAACRRDMP